jgi:hypothetical protein
MIAEPDTQPAPVLPDGSCGTIGVVAWHHVAAWLERSAREACRMGHERYWPFEVLPPDQRTPLHDQQIVFLEAAYRGGFRPYTFGGEHLRASAGDRSACIIRRTRKFWELVIGSSAEGRLAAYVAGFDVNRTRPCGGCGGRTC